MQPSCGLISTHLPAIQIWDYGHTDDLLRLLGDMAERLEQLERDEPDPGRRAAMQNEPWQAVIVTRDPKRQAELAEALARIDS